MRKVTFALAALWLAFSSLPRLFPAAAGFQERWIKGRRREGLSPTQAAHGGKQVLRAFPLAPSASGSTLESRGKAAMGFEPSKTTHHFLLSPRAAHPGSGNDPQDTISLEQIRKHFQHIAAAFAAGNFQIPIMVHDTVPPGATAMKRLRGKIQYTYGETRPEPAW